LKKGDILFARTGATTGKTHLVESDAEAVFASYLIRVRPRFGIDAGYLHSFFQSDSYWEQIIAEKEGSAQPNVNGGKLMTILVPAVEIPIQERIVEFLNVVRQGQDGVRVELPSLPPPIEGQRRVVERVEQLWRTIGRIESEATSIGGRPGMLLAAEEKRIWPDDALSNARTLNEVTVHLARGRQSEQGKSEHYLIKTQHVQQRKYIPSEITLAPHVASKVAPEALVKPGDILIACSAAGCLGRTAFLRDAGIMASTDTHVAIARANRDVVLPEYLYAYLRGAQGQFQLRSREKGDWQREKVGFRLTELNVADMRRVPVPIPGLQEQRKIVDFLERFTLKIDALRNHQARRAVEVAALRPSVLNSAFSGQL
jgi:type I restriction enzyme S subunit